ncbi:hypothetical protein PPERSA_00818 [Pseudocohnilembus persalinus]|uniref:Band 7 domain-containing protein n=1 Tax=Pseudocohnilembus persalinus TaxID=266149 RepID=A0A0V0QFT6_PSEPJ|nr:hypothetical protein PPERSA_00818 [Pseudocohnilembus persalinus]|eukprot:KRX01070.1 hypothetical protein PPERSA_00818 [Pseudocohnilembus persalinus]
MQYDDQGMAQPNMPGDDDDIKAADDKEYTCYEKCLNCCGGFFGCLRAWLPCICCCCPNPFIQVKTGTIALRENFGKYKEQLGPGLHQINPWSDKIKHVNLKTQVINLHPQQIMTNDNISIRIDAVVYYRIIESRKAAYRVQNLQLSVSEKAYGALRSACGEYTMQEMLEKREEVSEKIESYIDQYVQNWGVFIESVFIKDMQLNKDLQDDMAAAAKQKRVGQSKVISAKADVESAKLLREAADYLDSKAAMQIRYLETIQGIANKQNTPKVMFLPLNVSKKKGRK